LRWRFIIETISLCKNLPMSIIPLKMLFGLLKLKEHTNGFMNKSL